MKCDAVQAPWHVSMRSVDKAQRRTVAAAGMAQLYDLDFAIALNLGNQGY
jgi:hypothetical protein